MSPTTMHDLLLHLLTGAAAPTALDAPIDRALVQGAAAATVGGAFLAGYRAALAALVPTLGADPRAALCVTEDGGTHPAAMRTTVDVVDDGLVLRGAKRFVTDAAHADTLLVLAVEGHAPDGRARLALLRVPASSAGVTLSPLPPTSFVPDVSHAAVTFDDVRLPRDARLPGDGWTDAVKPFRTVEDLHVQAAIVAFVLAALRPYDDLRVVRERLVAQVLALRVVAGCDPRAPTTHVALAGCIESLASLAPALDEALERVPSCAWSRDRRILAVASAARSARRERAWETLGA